MLAGSAGLDAALIKRLEWAQTAGTLDPELPPGVRCKVLQAGYAGEPAATFGELFGARKP